MADAIGLYAIQKPLIERQGNIAVAGIRLALDIAMGNPPAPIGSKLSHVDIRTIAISRAN